MKNKAEQDRLHTKATIECRDHICVLCQRTPCEPAHWKPGRSGHRGMGSGKAGWGPEEWIPLCRHCHDLIDGRLGVSTFISGQRKQALDRLTNMFGEEE